MAGLLVYAVNEKLSDSKRNNSDGSNGKSENKIEQDVKEEKNSTSESDAKGVFDGNSNLHIPSNVDSTMAPEGAVDRKSVV